MKKKLRKVPEFKTDEEAIAFLDQDLSDLDYSQFVPMRFELKKKESSLNIRLPAILMDAVKAKAKELDMPYARYVRMVLEHDLRTAK